MDEIIKHKKPPNKIPRHFERILYIELALDKLWGLGFCLFVFQPLYRLFFWMASEFSISLACLW